MIELPVLNGYCTIQLYRKVGGNSFQPHTIVRVVCGNTLVDEVNFQRLNQYRWLMAQNIHTKAYYAERVETQNNKLVHISMAREILRLPQRAGWNADVADHKNHDTLDNTLNNLRRATRGQNVYNRIKFGFGRFKSVYQYGSKHTAIIYSDGSNIYFPRVSVEVEAALMYNYGADLVYGEFAELNVIPEDEMPTVERQWELYDMVIAKLREKKVTFDESRIV